MEDAALNAIWKALADPSRRKILDLVREKSRTTKELAGAFKMSRIGVMKHLGILEQAGLLVSRKEGRQRFHHLNAVPLQQIHQRWVAPHAQKTAQGLLNLKEHLEGDPQMSIGVRDFHIEQEVGIDAPKEKVFEALCHQIDDWWPHRLEEGRPKLSLDAKLGGVFMEHWENGGGALWGTVTRLKVPETLALTGPLGMSGPVQSVYRYDLEDREGKTLLKLSHKAAGQMTEDVEASYREGWQTVFHSFKKWVEKGEKA